MNKYSMLIPVISLALITGCQESEGHDLDTVEESESDHGHDHNAEERTLSYTVWTDKSELFVEFRPLVVGKSTRFAAHFSEMEHFKAVTEGKVTVSLIKGKTGIRHTVDAPDSPGIFKPSLIPEEAGIYTLMFELVTPTFSDKIILKDIEVFNSMEEAMEKIPAEEENPNEISFLKEQAWKMEFANAPVIRDTIYDVIKTGGQILPAQGDEKTVTATASGIVLYRKAGMTIGSTVSSGQGMFTISGGNITDNNIQIEFLKAKSNYEQAKSNFERKEKLYESAAISKAEYEEALLSYQLAETEYNNLSANYSKGGKSVNAPVGGYIKNLFKTEGEFVEIGDPLVVITQNKKLTIRADVNQMDYAKLNTNMSANFIFNGRVYDLRNLEGKLLSYGRSVSNENSRLPVYFELNNSGDLLPGAFIEVWIKTQAKANGLMVPVDALLEEYGQYSVIVQTSGEGFEKRNIETGISDGKYVEVLSGLNEGERVVTKGAYQVKMASMSGQVPAHGHSH